MENIDTNELIERYLNGSLSASDRQVVEARLTTDAIFKAEVELHRQLHAEFTDPHKLQLRDLLSDIVKETTLPPPGRPLWLKVLGIVLLILMSGWLAWLWFSSTQARPPIQQEIQPPSTQPVVVLPAQDTPAKPLEKIPAPIAMANPTDFATNPTFEPRLGSKFRDTDGAGDTVEMQSPVLGANFIPRSVFTNLDFRGTISGAADTAVYPLVIKIYNNQMNAEPLFQVLPIVSGRNSASSQWTFSSSPRLRLRPGLYYFTVERQAGEKIIFVGKFSVGKQ